MARKPRPELAGGIHHVFARGNDKRAIYRDDADRGLYLHLLERAIDRHRWCCLAYCLMPNHVHLVLETPEANLGTGMQRLHGTYARTFNERHARVGHLFQGRFGSVLVGDDAQLWQTLAYVAGNPVEAGLCAHPRAWPWSSFATAGDGPSPPVNGPRLLELLDAAGGDPRARYRELTDPTQRCDAPATLSRRTPAPV